ncbi:hypothetical protein FVE85_7938 [Porphyridium purpureum]|uniref:Uncharacterized protein n=1 Tax=Porphyridium purpureum TaxID=35688 RepID=A0A5J4YLS0_PORPP|nr:hypothetical protein FVE85_7938 [Porphyridium purpureum]|eukprot:POR9685..scf295_9
MQERIAAFVLGAALAGASALALRREAFVRAQRLNENVLSLGARAPSSRPDDQIDTAAADVARTPPVLMEKALARQMALAWNRSLDSFYYRVLDLPRACSELAGGVATYLTEARLHVSEAPADAAEPVETGPDSESDSVDAAHESVTAQQAAA